MTKQTYAEKLEKVYDTISGPELMIIGGCSILLLAPHSQKFVDQQKNVIRQMPIREIVKEIAIDIINEIKIEEGDAK